MVEWWSVQDFGYDDVIGRETLALWRLNSTALHGLEQRQTHHSSSGLRVSHTFTQSKYSSMRSMIQR